MKGVMLMYNHLSIYAFSSTNGLELLYSAKGFGKLQGALFGITKANRDNKLHSLSMSALYSLEKQSTRITSSQLEQYTLRNYPSCSIAYISAKADEALMQKFGITSLEDVNSLDRANKLELMLQHKELFELLKGYHLSKQQQLKEDICILRRQQEYKETQNYLESTYSHKLEKFQDCLEFEELKSTLKGYSFERVRNFTTRLLERTLAICADERTTIIPMHVNAVEDFRKLSTKGNVIAMHKGWSLEI